MSDPAHRGELKSGGSSFLRAIVPIIVLVLDFFKADEVFILPTRTTLCHEWREDQGGLGWFARSLKCAG
jgi:hypothetical protein